MAVLPFQYIFLLSLKLTVLLLRLHMLLSCLLLIRVNVTSDWLVRLGLVIRINVACLVINVVLHISRC